MLVSNRSRNPSVACRTGGLLAVLIIAAVGANPAARGSVPYQRLKSFGAQIDDGQNPQAALIQGSDGALYGTTRGGGSNHSGTVFRLNGDGSDYRILHHFGSSSRDGKDCSAALLEASDQALYGTTRAGGSNDLGTIFKVNTDGSDYSVLRSFRGLDGEQPVTALIQASDGALYGTTYLGGAQNCGTVFKLGIGGSSFVILHEFSPGADGRNPRSPLLQARDGMLYGTTQQGGGADWGTVFKLNTGGSGYHVLYSFDVLNGWWPVSALLEMADGALCGTDQYGNDADAGGTIFKLNKDGSGFSVVLTLNSPAFPMTLVEGGGALYSTSFYAGDNNVGMVFKINKDGTGYAELHSFSQTNNDGWGPEAGLLRGKDEVFYGTTSRGGEFDSGTVFRFLPPESPRLLGVAIANNAAQVRFTGTSGSRYQVLRSNNLSDWSMLATISMPASGVYTNLDTNPPFAFAFYRAVWIP
jgi:uncharacterized repeat protein (TIGR03803 family)